MVATRLSLIGMVFPFARSCAKSSAHLSPMSASQGRHEARTPVSNQRSRVVRFRPLGRIENPESQFAENNGIDGDFWLMCPKPRHDTRIGYCFRRFAQNIRITKYFTAHP